MKATRSDDENYRNFVHLGMINNMVGVPLPFPPQNL